MLNNFRSNKIIFYIHVYNLNNQELGRQIWNITLAAPMSVELDCVLAQGSIPPLHIGGNTKDKARLEMKLWLFPKKKHFRGLPLVGRYIWAYVADQLWIVCK